MVEKHYDESGYLTWSRGESGIITQWIYDRKLGLVVQRVEDAQTDGVSGVPAGWMTLPGNGRNIVTDYEYDEKKRLVCCLSTDISL